MDQEEFSRRITSYQINRMADDVGRAVDGLTGFFIHRDGNDKAMEHKGIQKLAAELYNKLALWAKEEEIGISNRSKKYIPDGRP